MDVKVLWLRLDVYSSTMGVLEIRRRYVWLYTIGDKTFILAVVSPNTRLLALLFANIHSNHSLSEKL